MDNITAFLLTLRKSEGTDAKDGYQYLFTSSPRNTLRFTDFGTHPNRKITANGLTSSAAGAYQIIYKTWQALCKKLGVSDFIPETQDKMAIELLKECGAYSYIISGDLLNAVMKANHIWASLPESPYGQPEHDYATIKVWYLEAGGIANTV